MQNLKDHYIKSLQDGRNVWLYGKKVDVTTDNNFAGHYVPFLIYFRYLMIPNREILLDM